MNTIRIKVPRKKTKIRVAFSPFELQRDIRKKQEIEEEKPQLSPKEIAENNRAQFTQKYVISDSNQPLEISLRDLPEDVLPLEDVKAEVQMAYDKGIEDGQDSARAIYMSELTQYQEWVRNIDSIAELLQEQFKDQLKELEELIVALSVNIAEHIIGHEIKSNPEIVIEQVRKAILSLDEDKIFRIKVNPFDLEVLEKSKSRLVSDPSMTANVKLSSDEEIDRGSCVLETSAGTIDARISKQLDIMLSKLSQLPLGDSEITEEKE